MNTIAFNQLPQIPDGDLKGITSLAALTTDSNGVSYVGNLTIDQMFNSGGTGCGCVYTVRHVIPTADVLTLNTTPVALGLNVPAGYMAVPVCHPVFRLQYGTVAYATNTNIRIGAVGATDPFSKGTGFLAATADTFCMMSIATGAANAIYFVESADFEVSVATGDPTAGDSDITIYLTYMLIEA